MIIYVVFVFILCSHVNAQEVCKTVLTCANNGLAACDRSTGSCPPCIYTTTGGKFTCWNYTEGTKTCPFSEPVAECPPSLTSSTTPTPLPAGSVSSKSTTTPVSTSGSSNAGSKRSNDGINTSSSKSNDDRSNGSSSKSIDNKSKEDSKENNTMMFALVFGGASVVIVLCIIVIFKRQRKAVPEYTVDTGKLESANHNRNKHNRGFPEFVPVGNPRVISDWNSDYHTESMDSIAIAEERQSSPSSVYSDRTFVPPPEVHYQGRGSDASIYNTDENMYVDKYLDKSQAKGHDKNDFLAAYNMSSTPHKNVDQSSDNGYDITLGGEYDIIDPNVQRDSNYDEDGNYRTSESILAGERFTAFSISSNFTVFSELDDNDGSFISKPKETEI